MRWLVLCLLLSGCAGAVDPTPPPPGQAHVLVVGGTVTESGPEPDGHGVCDVAAPPFSADDDERRIWYLDVDWTDWDLDADLFVIRLDRTDMVADDGCWTYRLETFSGDAALAWRHADLDRELRMAGRPNGVAVGDATLHEGEATTWRIDASCWCDPYYDHPGAYRYTGDLRVTYLGLWDRDDVIEVGQYADLPPLDMPY